MTARISRLLQRRRPMRLAALPVLALAAALPAMAADPIISDSRLFTDDRRVALLEMKIASLQREVNLIEDMKAIERLQQSFGHYISEGMAGEAAALFSDQPQASIEFAQQGVYLGRARIEAFLDALGVKAGSGLLRETPTMQGVVHVAADGQTAKGRWRSLVMAGRAGQDGRWIEGPYENEYVKEGGVWRIAKLHWYTTVDASYDQGWHKAPNPAEGPLPQLPPDRPPSIEYKAFPTFFLPPYHYFNPITGLPVAWDRPASGVAK
ncbi:MAG: nuclear transport factor 2 family protein [Nevskiaceae bacterium]|nr:nuclear transport factor 2 family protein [Nevskiaceae bacterium]